jgi:glycosyltransferase involved in cell wall biosynthesis
MKIVFLLPGSGESPIGGFKIVYQYADVLAGLGHQVSVAHASFLSSDEPSRLTRIRRNIAAFALSRLRANWRPDSWFKFKYRVKLILVPDLTPIFLPNADVYVATAWQTAERLESWRKGVPGKRIYLIQHLEDWSGDQARVLRTWTSGLELIVIARWLAERASTLGVKATYIPNAMDFEQFGVDTPIYARERSRVAMLYHPSDWKGSIDGLDAIRLAKVARPDLVVDLFGTSETPEELPGWITYYQSPKQSDLRALYNRAAIFVAPSWAEGWPLPPAEAMMCGAALVATDIGGHQEYCIDGETALLSPVKDPSALGAQIVRLLGDDELRQRIAHQGNKFIQQFSWNVAGKHFESVISGRETRE